MKIEVSSEKHLKYAEAIQLEIMESAKKRGTGISKRSIKYICEKIVEGKAVVAFDEDGTWVGFCYIETWSHGAFVANSGLIVSPQFRNMGIATLIKEKVFELSRERYPNAKIFGLTTGMAVMKINAELGYKPVVYSELTQDEAFWSGCKTCINYEILISKNRQNCLCTAMLYVPKNENEESLKEKNEKECSTGI
ncbi:N-acetyltransferase [Kaistella daneshvariae]|uniref:N-acetyltransferase n=1 Tax=Kaistella daneshvariae TaxID=2487074 RepID=A0ABN5SZL3_9FLAO|nr:GNAT family N-acetyltransferase [Kaistella daneshvariae]AZI67769.1 N-acetyltransferase [Kaistella daneshvariae]